MIETRIAEPMFQLSLFRIRAFTAGSIAGLVVAIARGGLQFMLIIWLQGIWLPLHGYNYSETPLWAGIFLLPLTAGFLVSGPVSGTLSDQFGSRGIATAGMVVFGGSFIGLMLLPVNFSYWAFALLIAAQRDRQRHVRRPELLLDHGQRPGPASRRGLGHALHLPELRHGPVDRGVLLAHDRRAGQQPAPVADQRPGPPGRAAQHRRAIGSLPPVSSLFAAVLGVNPIQHLLSAAGALASLPARAQRVLTGRGFFPQLIAGPFHNGLTVVFAVAAGLAAVAAVASLLRGGRYVHPELAAALPATPRPALPPGTRPPALPPPPTAAPPSAPPAAPAAEITARTRSTMTLTTLDPRPALVVIDLQKGIAALPGVPALDDVIQRSAGLAAAFRRHGLPVVLVNASGRAARAHRGQPARLHPAAGLGRHRRRELDQQPGRPRW